MLSEIKIPIPECSDPESDNLTYSAQLLISENTYSDLPSWLNFEETLMNIIGQAPSDYLGESLQIIHNIAIIAFDGLY